MFTGAMGASLHAPGFAHGGGALINSSSNNNKTPSSSPGVLAPLNTQQQKGSGWAHTCISVALPMLQVNRPHTAFDSDNRPGPVTVPTSYPALQPALGLPWACPGPALTTQEQGGVARSASTHLEARITCKVCIDCRQFPPCMKTKVSRDAFSL